MTGQEVIQQAMTLLGYEAEVGGLPGGESPGRRALTVVNTVAADAWYDAHEEPYTPLSTLAQALPFSDAVARTVLPYGVAMLLAQLQGDVDNQTLFATLYDQRRSRVGGRQRRIVDAWPTACH